MVLWPHYSEWGVKASVMAEAWWSRAAQLMLAWKQRDGQTDRRTEMGTHEHTPAVVISPEDSPGSLCSHQVPPFLGSSTLGSKPLPHTPQGCGSRPRHQEEDLSRHLNSGGSGATPASHWGTHEIMGGRVITPDWAHSWSHLLLCVVHGHLSSGRRWELSWVQWPMPHSSQETETGGWKGLN